MQFDDITKTSNRPNRTCPKCRFVFDTPKDCKNHAKNCGNGQPRYKLPPVFCDKCQNTYAAGMFYKKHKCKPGAKPRSKYLSVTCNLCNKTFPNRLLYNDHVRLCDETISIDDAKPNTGAVDISSGPPDDAPTLLVPPASISIVLTQTEVLPSHQELFTPNFLQCGTPIYDDNPQQYREVIPNKIIKPIPVRCRVADIVPVEKTLPESFPEMMSSPEPTSHQDSLMDRVTILEHMLLERDQQIEYLNRELMNARAYPNNIEMGNFNISCANFYYQ